MSGRSGRRVGVVAIGLEKLASGPRAVRVGIGPRRAADSLRRLLSGEPIEAVVNLGVCGALRPDLSIGDVVVIDGWTDGARPDPELRSALATHLDRRGLAWVSGLALTSPYALSHPWSKRRAFRCTGADICEMEGAALAAVCSDAGVPFAAVRTVVDDPDMVLRGPHRMVPELVRSLRALGRVARAIEGEIQLRW